MRRWTVVRIKVEEVSEMIDVQHRDGVAIVELAHGKVNAIDVELLEDLDSILDKLAADSEVAAIVLTGKGAAFSAGVDLRRVIDEGPEYTERLIASLGRTFEDLFVFPKPTVAAVNGPAIAGGCVMACACDRRLGAEGTRIGASELLVGVAFPAAAIEILRAACADRTDEVVFGGRIVESKDAVTLGMLDKVVSSDLLIDQAVATAEALGALQPEAFRLAKQQLRRPVLERIRSGSSAIDAAVVRQWALPDTRNRIEQQLERLSKR